MNPSAAQPNAIASLMPIKFIFGIFYFLLIRPQQKKQKDHEKMIGELKKNDERLLSKQRLEPILKELGAL